MCILFKSMRFKDIKYHIPVYQMGNTQLQSAQKTTHVLYFWNEGGSRIWIMIIISILWSVPSSYGRHFWKEELNIHMNVYQNVDNA